MYCIIVQKQTNTLKFPHRSREPLLVLRFVVVMPLALVGGVGVGEQAGAGDEQRGFKRGLGLLQT